jgi:uncharacterized protein YbjT (DUF2867 family)
VDIMANTGTILITGATGTVGGAVLDRLRVRLRTLSRDVAKAGHQAHREAPTRVSRQHAEIEDSVMSSELPYTLLRPQSFMQNTLIAAATVAADGKMYGTFKAGRLGMIDARDIGEVAAKVVTQQGHDGKVYTLTGPAAISFDDVAEALTIVTSADARLLHLSPLSPLQTQILALLGSPPDLYSRLSALSPQPPPK